MTYFYIIPSLIYVIVFYKQFSIIVESPVGDPHIKTKVAFLFHTMCAMSGMWLLYYKYADYAWIFFTIISCISLYAYTKKSPPNDERAVP